MYETKPYFYGTGRRKDSVARVRVYQGTGKVTINDRDIDNYFGLETLKLIVRSPLVLLGLEGKYDVVVRVSGGGVSGQAGAIRHGLSRALLQQSDENRTALKKAGFLITAFTALLRQSRFLFNRSFPADWGARLRISGGCPGGASRMRISNNCSSIAWAAEPPQRCSPVQQVQQRRPPPAAETGRSCWGRGQQDMRPAQGPK